MAGPQGAEIGATGQTIATTSRLLLRTFRLDDLPAYAAMNADLEVMRYLGGKALGRQESDEMAEWAQTSYECHGFGLLAVERRVDRAFIGMCGLHNLDWYPDDVEIAWRLARTYWGHGYATEAATAWLELAFGRFALRRVISVADAPNARSRAVMARLGMVLDHHATLEEDGESFEAVVYAVTADQWRHHGGGRASSDA